MSRLFLLVHRKSYCFRLESHTAKYRSMRLLLVVGEVGEVFHFCPNLKFA